MGENLAPPETPVREGYNFTGWNPALPEKYPEKDTKYTAEWVNEGDYTITYELYGGTNAPENPPSYNVETETITLKAPTKDGFAFTGWFESPDFSTTEVKEIAQGSTGDKTLYAKWELVSYTITYELNGGTNAPENPESYNVETETITLKDPVKTGYIFGGWYKAEDFTGDAVTKIPQGTTGDMTLYAKWVKEGDYTITYVLDGGTNVPENPPSYNVETETITLKDPAKPGYTFDGWYKTEDFTGEAVTEIIQGTTGNITLYAKWELVSYTITYELDGGTNASENPASYNVETETITLKDPAKAGYTFEGWYMAEDFTGNAVTEIIQGTTGNITLYAKWELVSYTITYELDGGTNASENPASYNVETETITLKDPAKAGYTFEGWYMAEDFTGNAVTEIIQGTTGNITLYAKWELVSYTITYELDGGTNAPENPVSYNVETQTITLKYPVKPGYTFEGWYKDSGFTGKITEIPQGTTGDITLYAKWEPVSYTITYELEGGTNASENPASYNVETGTITLKAPTKDKYDFKGWYKDGEFTDEITEIPQGTTGDITLYAKWELESYTITYELDGGTNASENPPSYNVETETITLKDPAKLGYTFAGWYMAEDFTGNAVTEIPQGTTGNITLYAKWELVSYTITYELDGGTNAPENPASYNVETETITLKDPVKPGCIFAGWYKDVEFTDKVTEITQGSTGDITLYTWWILIPELVYVDGGKATLSQVEVTLSSFYIGKYEVTQEEFVSVMTGNQNGIKANPSLFQGEEEPPAEGEVQERRPVEWVSWYDALVYCNLLSMEEGLTPCYTIKGSTNPADWGTSPTSKDVDWDGVTCNFNANGYRLPTEAEWEYAARGGQTGISDGSWDNTYSGSTTPDDVAWYGSNSDSKTHEVGKKQANALELYDMSGNVSEWCWDWYGNSFPSGTKDPAGPDTGKYRVMRGGGWNYYASYSAVSYRDNHGPYNQHYYYGIRLVRSTQ